MTWEKYCSECQRWGMENPYPDQSTFNRAYGISDVHEPLVITPKRDARKVAAIFDHHDGLQIDRKKPKPKPQKKSMTAKKEISPKKSKTEAKPKPPKPQKPRKTEEEKRAYQREWMRKFREKNPGAAYKYSKAWKEKNPEKVKEWNRQYMMRKRAAKKASQPQNDSTITKPSE